MIDTDGLVAKASGV